MADYKSMDKIAADCAAQNPPRESPSRGKHIAKTAVGVGAVGGAIGTFGTPVMIPVGAGIGAVIGGVGAAEDYPRWLADDQTVQRRIAQGRVDECVGKAARETPKPSF